MEDTFFLDLFNRPNTNIFIIVVFNNDHEHIYTHTAELCDFENDYYFSFLHEGNLYDLITYDTGDLLAARVEHTSNEEIIGFAALQKNFKNFKIETMEERCNP